MASDILSQASINNSIIYPYHVAMFYVLHSSPIMFLYGLKLETGVYKQSERNGHFDQLIYGKIADLDLHCLQYMVYSSLACEWPIKISDLFLFNETGYLKDRSRIFINVYEAFYQNLQAPSMHISVDVLKFQTLVAYKKAKSNSADPDQTASEEAV